MRDPITVQAHERLGSNGCYCAEGCIVAAAKKLDYLSPSTRLNHEYIDTALKARLYGFKTQQEARENLAFLNFTDVEGHAARGSLIGLNDDEMMPLPAIADLIEAQWLNPILAEQTVD